MDDTAFAARLAESGAAIERELDTLLGADPRPGEPARPERLIQAMRYATLARGERLRPFLVLASAQLFAVARRRSLLSMAGRSSCTRE